MKASIILATDDDGIWPIDHSPSVHSGHHSLAAEYCRAISTSLINSGEILKEMLQTMEQVCFSDMGNEKQRSLIENSENGESPCVNNTIIVHPDIIELIRVAYKLKPELEMNSAVKKYKILEENSDAFKTD